MVRGCLVLSFERVEFARSTLQRCRKPAGLIVCYIIASAISATRFTCSELTRAWGSTQGSKRARRTFLVCTNTTTGPPFLMKGRMRCHKLQDGYVSIANNHDLTPTASHGRAHSGKQHGNVDRHRAVCASAQNRFGRSELATTACR